MVSKEEIVLYNKKLGIETIFSSDLENVGKVDKYNCIQSRTFRSYFFLNLLCWK